jgi:hypothetical protein
MSDLDALIANAIKDATDTGEVPEPMEGEEAEVSDGNEEGDAGADDGGEETSEGDSSDVGEESDSSTEGEDGEGDRGGSEESAEETEEESTETKPELSAEEKQYLEYLKKLDINPPDEKAAKNRIPYGRSLRTLVNKVRKFEQQLSEAHGKEIAPLKAKLSGAESQLVNLLNADRMLRNDPDMFMRTIAAMFPDKYGKYVSGQSTAKPADPNAGMPAPDLKYDDGSTGYSPEQYAKLQQWNIDQAVARVKEENDRTYKPLLDREKARAFLDSQASEIQNRVGAARQAWGVEFYNANENEIAKAINDETVAAKAENRAAVPFEILVSRVLIPKMQEKVDKARANVIEEQKRAPKGATKTRVQSSKPHKTGGNDDRPLEDKMTDLVEGFKRTHGIR